MPDSKNIFMKKFLLLLAVAAPFFSFAQHFTSTFEDGKKIDYDIISDKFNDSKPLNILFGGFLTHLDANGEDFDLGASYYSKDKFFALSRLGIGAADNNSFTLTSISLEGIYFLRSWDKSKEIKFPVKSEYAGNNTIKKYMVKHDLQKRLHWGPHIGFSFPTHFVASDYYNYSGEINFGAGFFRGKFLSVVITDDQKPIKMRGTGQFAAYADIVYYMYSYNSNYTGTKYSPLGFKMYINGKGSLWGKRDFGFTYTLGAGTGGVYSFYPIIGFGVYGGF